MGDTRGKRYSSVRLADGETDPALEAYWDFTLQDVGEYDLEAFVRKIHNMTSSGSRVIAYGQAFNQVLYGLSQENRLFGNMTNSVYGFAPCVFYNPPTGGLASYAQSLGQYRELKVYSINGPNWEADLATICTNLDT